MPVYHYIILVRSMISIVQWVDDALLLGLSLADDQEHVAVPEPRLELHEGQAQPATAHHLPEQEARLRRPAPSLRPWPTSRRG